MQKKIIALAVAALASGAAFAQSNVTVYGVMDVMTGVAKANNANGNQSQTFVNAGGNSGSRLGFKGEEDLGNGLKALFLLELGTLNVDSTANTNNITSTRESFVGLSSNSLGTVRLGRTQTAGWRWSVKYDTMGQASLYSTNASLTNGTSILSSTGGSYGRQNNAVTYISPNFSGLTIRADVAAGEQVTGTSGVSGVNKSQGYYSIGADYDNGPLAVGLVINQINDLGGTLNNMSSAKIADWALGGTYDFKVAKPFATYQQTKKTPTVGNSVTGKLFGLGVAVPVSAAGVVKASFSNYSDDQANAVKAKGYALAYEHSMSKRTMLYAGYQQINNGTYGAFYTSNAAAAAPSLNKNSSVYGVGMVHSF